MRWHRSTQTTKALPPPLPGSRGLSTFGSKAPGSWTNIWHCKGPLAHTVAGSGFSPISKKKKKKEWVSALTYLPRHHWSCLAEFSRLRRMFFFRIRKCFCQLYSLPQNHHVCVCAYARTTPKAACTSEWVSLLPRGRWLRGVLSSSCSIASPISSRPMGAFHQINWKVGFH